MITELWKDIEAALKPTSLRTLRNIVNVYNVTKGEIDALRKDCEEIIEADELPMQAREFLVIISNGLPGLPEAVLEQPPQ